MLRYQHLRLRILLLFAYLVHTTQAAEGIYSIIAPNTIRPNAQYHVAVSVHDAREAARFKLGIISATYTDFKTVEVQPFSTQLVEFQTPKLRPDRYSLTAEGLTSIVFTNETILYFESKQYTALLQTDKAIYKPGDLVHYHLLVLDTNLKPARAYGRTHLEIRDAGNNLIRRYEDLQLVAGTYANEFQLADYPKFGEWSIYVQVDEEQHVFTFEVLDYILPKFVVDIETAKHAVYKENLIAATVKAYYAFGQPIQGEATLSIYPTFYGSLQPFVNDLITRKVVPIDGSAYFEFDIQKELNLKPEYEREYLLDALVEDKSTGSVQNFSKVIKLHLDAYRVETMRIPNYYIPGVPFEVTAKVIKNDETKLKDFKTEITGYVTDATTTITHNKTLYNLNGKGEVKMKFVIPMNDRAEYYSVITDYMGIITELGKIPHKHLHTKNYVTAKILNDNPLINQEVAVAVQSNVPLKYFIYQIVARGDIIITRTVHAERLDSIYQTFKFLATFAMMPRAKLLVYTVMNGEFVYDEQIIEFEPSLLNSVQIEAPLRAPPGQNIDITISTKPYSLIGLMVVDQNAINIRSGNELTYESLMHALEDYELSDANTDVGSPGKLSGVITMSNAEYIIEKEPESTPSYARSNAVVEDEDKLTTIRKTDIGPAHTFEVNTLAPGKGRYAFSYVPKPFWHDPRVHVMHPPAPTWLFMNITAGSDGRSMLQRRIPSTMTSWVLSAFSLDAVTGLGLTRPVRGLQSYKEFYITTELPYSVRLGEIIAIPFVVTNNKDDELAVDVTFYNTAQDFDMPPVGDKPEQRPKIELYRRRSLLIPPKSSKSISFIVKPKLVGPLTVKAVANTPVSGDAVEQSLLVEHPGATETVNRGFLFELSSNPNVKQDIQIRVPRNAIPESTQIQISAVGDIAGSMLGNLEHLISLPTGCGEQSMVHFMPIVMVLKYLERVRQSNPTIERTARKNLETGYQHLLYYRHDNGAFSAFGLSHRQSSTWLTAYAARALRLASQYIQVDEFIIAEALKYLANAQQPNGDFAELGDIFENFNDNGISLTAFVTLAFMENANVQREYGNTINKALDFITRSLDSSNDLHAMAIGTYVLSLAKHNAKIAFLQRLDSMAVNEAGYKWWNKTAPVAEGPSPWYNQTRSTNIEISAYAALTMLTNNLITDAVPVVKWLIDQRNENGGFVSSQDTVVGLQALLAFGERFSSQANDLKITSTYAKGTETVLNINAANSMALQSYELPNNIKNISISASGRGMAYAQLTYKYNTNVTSAWPRFVLDPTVNRNSHPDYLHLSACASFVPIAGESERSNMAVMEIYLPSGFVVDTDTLPTIESNDRIKHVETKRRNTVVVIYFDYLDRREVCPTLHAYKTVKVTSHRPVPVIMYDYYDNARRARQFYRAPKSTLCDICDAASCGAACEKAEKRASATADEVKNGLNSKSEAMTIELSLFTMLLAMLSALM